MAVNRDKPDRWKADIIKSADMYNAWFTEFASVAYRETRILAMTNFEGTLHDTDNLTKIKVETLKAYPGVLPSLRMSTCPPLTVDRLIALAGVSKKLVDCMEEGTLPPRMRAATLKAQLDKIGTIIEKMADPDIFVWLGRKAPASGTEVHRAATIVADRLCGTVANSIVRNAHEKRPGRNERGAAARL